ncbi:hypothetical protein OROHE_006794 [Orobanche hederae]
MTIAPMAVVFGGGSEVGGIASRFWIKFKREAGFAKYSAFVVGLTAGELKIDTFRHYASRTSISSDPSPLQNGKLTQLGREMSTLQLLDTQILLLATAYGNIVGVKGPAKLATPFERTKIAAYILGAIMPCIRLYVVLGKEL